MAKDVESVPSGKSRAVGHACALGMSVLFGLLPPFTKAAMNCGIGGFDVVALRSAGGCVLFWITSLFVRDQNDRVPLRDVGLLFLASFSGIVLSQSLMFVGIQHTSPVNAGIAISLSPVFTFLMSVVVLHEKATARRVVGMAMALCGAVVIALASNRSGGGMNVLGDALCVLSPLAYAVYLVFFRRLLSRHSVITVNKWLFLFSAAMMLPFSFGHLQTVAWESMPTAFYLEMLYVIAVCSFVTFILLIASQQRLKPHEVGIYNYVQPVVAIGASLVMGVGTFGISHAVAAVLVFVGVWLVVGKHKERST